MPESSTQTPDACSYERHAGRHQFNTRRHQLLMVIWLSCSAFTWPGRVPHLSYSAAHGTHAERVEALRLLEEYPSQASNDACLAGLEDAASEVRAQAAECVGAQADARATTNLLDLVLAKEPLERAAAVAALGRLAPARALSSIEQALADPQPPVRVAAARALSAYVRAGSFEQSKLAALLRSDLAEQRLVAVALLTDIAQLRDAARDQTPEVRAAALRALGRVGGPQVLPALQGGLSDPDETVRLSAIAALGDSQVAGALSLLRAPLTGSTSDVRAARTALAALGRIDDPGALSAIVPALTRPLLVHSAVNALVARALRRHDAETLKLSISALQRAIETTQQAGASASPNQRDSTATVLELERNEGALPALARAVLELSAYCDAQPAVLGLAQQLVEPRAPQLRTAPLNASPDAAQLLRQLDDPDPRVRERSSAALGDSVDNAVLLALAQRLEQRAPHAELSLQACAGVMLRASKSPDAIPSALRARLLQQFQSYLTQPDETLALSALYALRASHDRRSATWIAGLLRGSSAPLRAAAVQALGDFDQPEARRMLRDLLRSGNVQNASNAALALAELGSDREVEALLRAAERGSWPLPPTAAYAAARITQRGATRKHSLERVLCRFAQLRDSYMLSNSVSALAALGADACDAQIAPRNLLDPALPSALRVAAATWLQSSRPRTPEETAEHSALLVRCAADHDDAVAAACRPHPPSAEASGLTLLRLWSPDGQTALKSRMVALRLPDATVYIAQSDAAGQVLVPRALSGAIQLEDPTDHGAIALPARATALASP